MEFSILVTGPAYGTQQATSAWFFANSLIKEKQKLDSIFFIMKVF